MKILILGTNGMLGHKLYQSLRGKFDVFGTIRGDLESVSKYGIFDVERTIDGVDVTEISTVRSAIERTEPDVVINAVGVIKQLPSASDVVKTLTVNSIFPHKLAELGERMRFRTITISTDCVFSGEKGHYLESDICDALDLYGQSKHFGEVTSGDVLTLRTSIIGPELGTSHSLFAWFLSNKGGRVKGYRNAIYSGFPTIVFADIISGLITDHRSLRGLFHVSSNPISKYSLLSLINERLGLGIEIEPYEDLRLDRSLDSSLFRNTTGIEPPEWPEMVDRMCSDLSFA